jgi:hypothetical protein
MSVLRTTAVATSPNVLKSLVGTTVGVVAGGAVVVGFGSDTDVLWAVLPVAVLVAVYTPGVSLSPRDLLGPAHLLHQALLRPWWHPNATARAQLARPSPNPA